VEVVAALADSGLTRMLPAAVEEVALRRVPIR
jgi:hypothetical protein